MSIRTKPIIIAKLMPEKKLERVPPARLTVAERMEEHKRILATLGVTDLSGLGKLVISGAVIPKPGVLTPESLKNTKPQETRFHSARRLARQAAPLAQGDPHAVETVIGSAQVLTGYPFRILKPTARKGVTWQSLTDAMAVPVPTTMPLDCAYWAATSIVIADETMIVLQQPHRFLVLIAEEIEVGEGVSITWQREVKSIPAPPPTPPRPKQVVEWATSHYATNGTPGEPGTQGGPGDAGSLGPEIEIWTLSMQGESPLLDVSGQDGFDGGRGGNGGPGGHGQPGQRRGPKCKPPAGTAGWGGNGGTAGNGGPGGDGGHGGKFSLYAPGETILRYAAQGFYIDASGGARGRGGLPGDPGPGGSAGAFDWGQPGKDCDGDGSAGSPGQPGSRGSSGIDGNPGGFYSDALSLIPIDEEIFRIQSLKPAIVNLSVHQGVYGEQIEAFGERFSGTDVVVVGGFDAPTSYVSENQLSFTVPLVNGGFQIVQVRRQDDGALSNRETFCIFPVITHVEQLQQGVLARSDSTPPATFPPGSEIILVGSGFAPGVHVRVLGEYVPDSDIRFIDSQRVACKVLRPSETPRVPYEGDKTGDAGELVEIRVSLATGEESSSLPVRLRAFKMAVFGDSIVWGQGLQEHLKFHSLVEQYVSEQRNIGVYKSVRAHSGATIGSADKDEIEAEPLHGEINTSKPTIRQQVKAYTGAREAVSLVLLDGGINDFHLIDILNFDGPNIPNHIKEYVYDRMTALLELVTGARQTDTDTPKMAFPNAKVVVTGYYQIVSEDTSLDFLELWLTYCWGPIAPIIFYIDKYYTHLVEEQLRKIAQRCDDFARIANQRLADAVKETNEALGQEKVYFADPKFAAGNAIFATNSLLWGFSAAGSVEDTPDQGGVAPEREAACAAVPADQPADGPLICAKASVGHPNVQGAARYAYAVKRLPILA